MKAVSILFRGGGIARLELNDDENLIKTIEVLKEDMVNNGPFELTNKRLSISIYGLKENIPAIIVENNDC